MSGTRRIVGAVTATMLVGMPATAQTGEGARGVTVLRAPAPATPVPMTEVAKPVATAVAPTLAGPATPPLTTSVVAPPLVTPAPGRPTAMFKACPRPFGQPAVTLAGGTGFDRAMGSVLKRRPDHAVIDLAHPFAVGGEAPAALTPWLNEVKASGGIVSATEYCRDTRGLFGWVGRMFRAAKGKGYKAAEGYDAVLHVDGIDQKVTQVEFRRRAS